MTGDMFNFNSSLSGYTFMRTQTTNANTLTVASIVPELATWTMLGAAVVGMLAARRRNGRHRVRG